jgi:hypothetical protein
VSVPLACLNGRHEPLDAEAWYSRCVHCYTPMARNPKSRYPLPEKDPQIGVERVEALAKAHQRSVRAKKVRERLQAERPKRPKPPAPSPGAKRVKAKLIEESCGRCGAKPHLPCWDDCPSIGLRTSIQDRRKRGTHSLIPTAFTRKCPDCRARAEHPCEEHCPRARRRNPTSV